MFNIFFIVEEKTNIDEFQIPENPEVVVFATYWSTPKYPVKVSVLGEMVGCIIMLKHCLVFTYFNEKIKESHEEQCFD